MPDVFDRIEWAVRDRFGEELVCVHVGNVEECDIKRHPTYSKFAEAIQSGVRSAPTSRLWESIIAMGRLRDLDGNDTWRMVILDCITPCFRSLSASISRDFRVECEEIRSAMVVAALEVWADTATGVPPRHVRDRMVKAAFDVAFLRGKAASSECSTDDVEMFRPEAPVQNSALNALSIIDVSSIRDTDVAEKIRGERFGSLLQRLGCFDMARGFHGEIRTALRSGSVSRAVKVSRLARSRISSQPLLLCLGPLPLVHWAPGSRKRHGDCRICRTPTYQGRQFPFPAARAGRGYKVTVRALMHFMDIPDVILHVDDVENGALHASGGVR